MNNRPACPARIEARLRQKFCTPSLIASSFFVARSGSIVRLTHHNDPSSFSRIDLRIGEALQLPFVAAAQQNERGHKSAVSRRRSIFLSGRRRVASTIRVRRKRRVGSFAP